MACVYQHIRTDKNEVFYIGISRKDKSRRAYERHRFQRNRIWHNITSKTEYVVEILYEGIPIADACRIEKELIEKYGRIHIGTGTLANLTAGGEDNSGYVFTEEQRRKKSEAQKGRVFTRKTREKLSIIHKGKPKKKHSEEARRRKSERMLLNHPFKGQKLSPEIGQKISVALRGGPGTRSRATIDTSTGIEYSSLKIACQELELSYSSASTYFSKKGSFKSLVYKDKIIS